MRFKNGFLLIAVLISISSAFALRPGLPRITWTTEHFSLTIDRSKQDLLPELGSLAEACYQKQAAFFDFKLAGRIQMVFLDEQDYANGSAYSPQKWVVIYLPQAHHLLRGRTRWLQGVLAHEIGHIFTLRKMGDVSYFLGLEISHRWHGKGTSDFEESAGWNYGYIPPWLAEGLAQYAAEACGYDTMDTHRQMVLRVAAASHSLLSLYELKGFAWDGRRNEMIYTQGYALVTYLKATFGADAINQYLKLADSEGWQGAFRPAFGKNLEEIYADWKADLESRSQLDQSGDGDYLLRESPGPYLVESFPTMLIGKRMLYLSSRHNDYAQTDLYVRDSQGATERVFERATSIRAAQDERSALFTASRFSFLNGDVASELYRYDAVNGTIRQLTTGGRIARGCEAGNGIYGLRNHRGKTSIVKLDNGMAREFWVPPDSMDIVDIAGGRSDQGLTLVTTSGFGGDIQELDLETKALRPLAVTAKEEVDPFWSGDTLFFSADYSGRFDIYAKVDTGLTRLSRVSGGAFQPFVQADGIWVSAYGSNGFRLMRLRPQVPGLPPPQSEPPAVVWSPPPAAEYQKGLHDQSTLGFIGYTLKLSITREPGYAFWDTSYSFSFSPGNKAVASVGGYWQNPSGVVDANFELGISEPLDYSGPMHLDESSFEVKVKTFLPTLVVGGSHYANDLPDLRVNSFSEVYYDAYQNGHAGLEWRLSEHWDASLMYLLAKHYGYRGMEAKLDTRDKIKTGSFFGLNYENLRASKNGITQGMTYFLNGRIQPKVSKKTADFSRNGGISVYTSLARVLYLQGSVYQTQEYAPTKGWMFGSASAYFAIPLGIRLGSRGGTGFYLDQAYPGISYAAIGNQGWRIPDGNGYLPSYPGTNRSGLENGYSPRYQPFNDMLAFATTQSLAFTMAIKTMSILSHSQELKVGVRFDAEKFSDRPIWSIQIAL